LHLLRVRFLDATTRGRSGFDTASHDSRRVLASGVNRPISTRPFLIMIVAAAILPGPMVFFARIAGQGIESIDG
jgi:hypothetical protein